jgi:hypothetical protein
MSSGAERKAKPSSTSFHSNSLLTDLGESVYLAFAHNFRFAGKVILLARLSNKKEVCHYDYYV